MSDLAINVENISKQYKISAMKRRHDTLRDHMAAWTKSLFRRNGHYSPLSGQPSPVNGPPSSVGGRSETFWALKNVSLEISAGQTVGIIGRNGAGKSTLLKILSRITEPTSGKATVRGRLGSLLEVGTGFHHELTGRENVYLSGAIMGMKKIEIDRKFDEIVAFAEIEKFIDTPVKHYSSGMYVRLAFAVAAHLEPDILLLDEVLSVGDLAFQTKCIEHAKRLRNSGATVLFVSHNMFSIKSMCGRVVYLSNGQVRFDSGPEDGIALYEKENQLETAPWAKYELTNSHAEESIRITKMEILDEAGGPCHVFNFGERMRIRVGFEALNEIKDPNFSVSVFRSDNVGCCNFNTAMDGFIVPSVSGKGSIELLTPPLKLVAAQYATHVIVRNAKSAQLYTAQVGENFHVRHHVLNDHYGVFHEGAVWSWGNNGSGMATSAAQEELNTHD